VGELDFGVGVHTGVVHIGPLTLHMYGLTLLVAILACVALTGRRWVAQGGEWELVTRVAVWGVAFGVVGARLYHDITSWSEVPSPKWQGIFEVWTGGIGVWGGIALGALVGSMVVRRASANVGVFWTQPRRALLARIGASATGGTGSSSERRRLGSRSTLPIGRCNTSPRHYQPTFLYELIWTCSASSCCSVAAFRIKPPGLFALYIVWYTFGRFFEGCCASTRPPSPVCG
jgi:prolipoprotein diacylglyceryltransferase